MLANARRHKSDEHDLDDYEEQTLPAQARSGELGEMLQEAHLDARIQMRLGQTAGEEDDEATTSSTEKRKKSRQPKRKRLPASRGANAAIADAAGSVAAGLRAASGAALAPLDADLRSAHHLRPAEAGAGDPGADCQGADRQEGRAHHQPHRAAGPLPGLHAHGEPRGREPQDRLRRGTPSAEADSDCTSAAKLRADSLCAPRPKAHRKKSCAPICAS